MLDLLFRPRNLAVIGASNKELTIGHRVIRNLLDHHFQGTVYPINPREATIQGLRAYSSILDLPEQVDLVNIVVKNVFVPELIADCGKMGVRFAIIHSSGFAEAGQDGKRLENAVGKEARHYGIRIFGPNSQGVMNSDKAVSLYANFTFTPMKPGMVSICAQSGGVAELINLNLRKMGSGFRLYASNGNASDVSIDEILTYMAEDPETKVIVLYLEHINDIARFVTTCRRITSEKPILAYQSGSSMEAARAISSHTGALISAGQHLDLLYERCRIKRFDSIEQMIQASIALAQQPKPVGNNIAIVTNAGGPGIVAVDESMKSGLKLAVLSEETRSKLVEKLLPEATVGTIVDLAATAGPEHFSEALSILGKAPEVDGIIVTMVTPFFVDCENVARRMVEASSRSGKPFLATVMTNENWDSTVRILGEGGIPVFDFPEDSCRAMAAMDMVSRLMAGDEERSTTIPYSSGFPEWLDLVKVNRQGFLDQESVFELLEKIGLAVVGHRFIENRFQLIKAASSLGYPLVLKIDSSEIVHKTDSGGIAVNLRDSSELTDAFDKMEAIFGRIDHRYLLQSCVGGGLELVVGVKKIAGLGHALMFGLGGIFIETIKDVVFRLTPIGRRGAEQMLSGIKAAALLDGVRGQGELDREALIRTICTLSALVNQYPQIDEIDLNPLIARPGTNGLDLVDARIRLEECDRG